MWPLSNQKAGSSHFQLETLETHSRQTGSPPPHSERRASGLEKLTTFKGPQSSCQIRRTATEWRLTLIRLRLELQKMAFKCDKDCAKLAKRKTLGVVQPGSRRTGFGHLILTQAVIIGRALVTFQTFQASVAQKYCVVTRLMSVTLAASVLQSITECCIVLQSITEYCRSVVL